MSLLDTRTFYGQKEHDLAVRVIPSASDDSELEESQEEWIPDSSLKDI